MRVLELWRHPVKSFQGERLEAAEFVDNGMAGDRAWGVLDTGTGKVLTGRREPGLLLASARLGDDGLPTTSLPDGGHTSGLGAGTDAALTAWLARPVSLVAAADLPPQPAEMFTDATDDSSDVLEWNLMGGRFVDVFPLLLLTTASLRAGASHHTDGVWDVRRFRPNVLIEADGTDWVEDAWSGHRVRIGDVELQAIAPCGRCTMVTRPQPELDKDLDMFRTLNREHGATFGMWATVTTPGTVRAGDEVEVEVSG
jgi:uncharacterized protein YcbX